MHASRLIDILLHNARSGRTRIPGILLGMVCLIAISGCTVQLGQTQVIQPGNGISVPVRVIQNPGGGTSLLINLTINGKGPYTFVLDTGAESSLIDSTVARNAGLSVVGGPEPISGVGGVQQAIPVQINKWSVGKLRLPPTTIDSASFQDDRLGNGIVGLLGSDVLSQFGTVTISYSAGTLTVYKQVAVTSNDFTSTIWYSI